MLKLFDVSVLVFTNIYLRLFAYIRVFDSVRVFKNKLGRPFIVNE